MSNFSCPPPTTLHSTPYQGGPQIGAVTFTNPNVSAYPAGDLWSGPLNFPARLIMLASSGQAAGSGESTLENSLYFHFTKLGKTYSPTNPNIVPTGLEPWIPIRETGYITSAIDRNGWYIKFEKGHEIYQQGFYIDFGAESTDIADRVTFIYFDHIDDIVWPNRVGGNGGV
jgi:hypothetical protein